MIEFDYDFVIENGLWLEDQGSRFSRYMLNDASVWVDHYETDIVNDPSDVE